MSPIGPSRHIAPPRILGRERGIAEIDRPTSIAEGDARDPSETFALYGNGEEVAFRRLFNDPLEV